MIYPYLSDLNTWKYLEMLQPFLSQRFPKNVLVLQVISLKHFQTLNHSFIP